MSRNPWTAPAGLVTGAIGVVSATSYAALVFGGDLTGHLAAGIAIFLVSGVALRAVAALGSSLPPMHAGPQAAATAVLALVAADVARGMPEGAPDEAVLATVIAAMVAGSILVGLALVAIGRFGSEGLVRFIPYPVVGGFLAGTGWLLCKGSLAVMGTRPGPLAAGAGFAIATLAVRRRFAGATWVLPAALLAGIVVAGAALEASGLSLDQARALGWFLGPFPGEIAWRPPGPSLLAAVDASVLAARLPSLLSLVAIAAIGIPLTAGGLELLSGRDLDLARELRVAGWGNLVAACLGGVPGYHAPSESALAWQMGARTRAVGLVSAGVYAAALAAGPAMLSCAPRPLLGGLLAYLGAGFLLEWVVGSGRRLAAVDRVIVLAIVLVIATAGFLEGVGLGLAIALVLFAVDYSRVDVAENALDGRTARSNVARSPEATRVLDVEGAATFVLKLRGYLFFGTAHSLLAPVRRRLEGPAALRHVVLDLARVTGLDSSALLGLRKFDRIARSRDLTVVLTGVPPALRPRLAGEGLLADEGGSFREAPDLDRGLEWCEERLLEAAGVEGEGGLDVLETIFPEPDVRARFAARLEAVDLAPGEALFGQGEPPAGLYFLARGRLSVLVEKPGREPRRLRTFVGGTVVGEMGLYQDAPRSATVRADAASRVLLLAREAFARLEVEEPATAARFHRHVIGLLADRLRHAERDRQVLSE